jgi:hypothetical protein
VRDAGVGRQVLVVLRSAMTVDGRVHALQFGKHRGRQALVDALVDPGLFSAWYSSVISHLVPQDQSDEARAWWTRSRNRYRTMTGSEMLDQ